MLEWLSTKTVQTTPTKDLALAAVRKHLQVRGHFDHYTGIVTLHGLARLATETAESGLIEQSRRAFLPYARGTRPYAANFAHYTCGGNGAAYLLWKGLLPEGADAVRKFAAQLVNDAPRDPQGLFCLPTVPAEHRLWIDAVFAVVPFLLFAGRALGEDRYVEEAYFQASGMVRVLEDPENGLLHQCKNFRGRLPGRISEDHWSRGNGWGIYGLTELACHLPADHPRKAASAELYRRHVHACLAVQDGDGLWHQEMTVPASYVETSGSALILYAIGAGIQAGILDLSHREAFARGVTGLLAYISDEVDIFHTCGSCLCPGEGTILDYMARAPIRNDPHAFGPVVLAMGQAHILGIPHLTRN